MKGLQDVNCMSPSICKMSAVLLQSLKLTADETETFCLDRRLELTR